MCYQGFVLANPQKSTFDIIEENPPLANLFTGIRGRIFAGMAARKNSALSTLAQTEKAGRAAPRTGFQNSEEDPQGQSYTTASIGAMPCEVRA